LTPRVVLDTNVVVSALVFQHGRISWIRDAWMAGRVTPLASRATVEEILCVLTYPKLQLSSEDIGALVADYLPFVQTVEVEAGGETPAGLKDPDDRIFLDLAKAGRANFLVTGDRELLGLSSVGECRIIAPAELAAVLEGGQARE
jgi:uncharacterized protein